MHFSLSHSSFIILVVGRLLATATASPVTSAQDPYSTPTAELTGPGTEGFAPTTGNLTQRDIRGRLPNNARSEEHEFQPVLDFDRDGCHYTAAIDPSGNKNPGLAAHHGVPPNCLRHTCWNPDRLQNSNVYSRSRCNNGWCAIMYEYYFEKDQIVCGSFAFGHKHDWENIVVFTQNGQVKRVAPSCHGEYSQATSSPRLLDGKRAKVVYHKDGGGTHCFRMAAEQDENIENHTGKWVIGELVGWTGWPSTDLRNKAMENYGEGGNTIRAKLSDAEFAANLQKAMGGQVPGFNPEVDG